MYYLMITVVMCDLSGNSGTGGSSRGKKRKRNPEKWAQNLAKARRNSGKEYTSRTTKQVIPGKVIGPPCADGCFDIITLPVVEALFKEFWDIGNYDLQNAYIQKLVKPVEIKRRRRPKNPSAPGPRRTCNLQYTVMFNNTSYNICKFGFLSVFGLTKGRIVTAMKKITSSSIPAGDLRGKHLRANKNAGVQSDRVREHINNLPTVSSHSSRSKSPHKRALDSHLSISRLYIMYLQWMRKNHPDEHKVKESYYRSVFKTEFNSPFKPFKTDTCTQRDYLKTLVKAAEDTKDAEGNRHCYVSIIFLIFLPDSLALILNASCPVSAVLYDMFLRCFCDENTMILLTENSL